MGHAAPISLGAGCFRLGPRRPGGGPELFGGGPSAACSAEVTGRWLPVLADPVSGDAGGWCRLTEPPTRAGRPATPVGRGQVGSRPARCVGYADRRARRTPPAPPP